MEKLRIVALLAIFALQGVAVGQTATVSGTVRDAASGEPMPFVNVGLMRVADTVFVRGATTDLGGRYAIVADTGHYLLQATSVGYQPHVAPIALTGAAQEADLKLQAGTTLQEVQVVADRPLYAMDGEKNLYNTHDDPSIQTGTLSDALQNAPGVEVDAEGNITLRGVSSVEIWINDRPSHMNEEALKQYIKQLPAGAVERIEVITNPSARYSTTGGVINIVTNQTITRNELLCVGVRANTMPSVSPWVSYVWANEKVDFNVYLNGSYTQYNMGADGTNTLLDNNLDTSRYQAYHNSTTARNMGGYAGLNFNWNIDSMTNLAAWAGAYPYWSRSTSDGDYTYREYMPVLTDMSYLDSSRSHGFGGGGYMGVWFEHRFDTAGRKLSLNLNGNLWANDGSDNQDRYYRNAAFTGFNRQTANTHFGPGMGLGANYTMPMKHDFELEAGAEIDYNYNIDSYTLDTLTAAGAWSNVALRSTGSTGRSWSPALYATLQKRWGTFTAKVGLRGESSMISASGHHGGGETPMTIDTAFFGLVPSLHLSYRTKDFQNYSLSYTRRFSDPSNMFDLMPFRIYSDYSFSTGNPNLLRTYTHNVEAAWSKFLMGFGMVSLSAYFRANTNERGTMTAAGSDPYYGSLLVNYTYPDNIGSSHTEGLNANITYRPTGFFNVRADLSVFNYAYDYKGFSDSRVSWSARVNVWAKVWNRLELFANAHYASPRLGLYSMSVANKGIDLGLSSDLLDRRLSVYLNVNDIFGMAQWGENTTAPQYQTTGSQTFDSRFVSLGLTWRIGKMELESKARQGATEGSTPMGM